MKIFGLIIFIFCNSYLQAQVSNIKLKPSLIPMPQKLEWGNGNFNLSECKKILVKEDSLLKEATWLQNHLNKSEKRVIISKTLVKNENHIELRLGKAEVKQNNEEAYSLIVTPKKSGIL